MGRLVKDMENTQERMKVKVYRDGNSFIGILPNAMGIKGVPRKRDITPEREAFRKYYIQAKKENVPKRQLVEYLQSKMFNDENSYILYPEEIKELIKKEATRIHNKEKTYYRKLGFFQPNWFVTFTYDDEKTDVETFERQLRRCLSNLAQRKEWRYIGAKEHGSERGRVHFHFIVYIPEGNMVGELFKDYHWNKQKRRRDYFTNNTFFNERFGYTDFQPVAGCDITSGTLKNYLTKYIIKEDARLIYSRHLPTQIETEIIVEEDVFMTFYDHTRKVYLALEMFLSDKELAKLFVDEFALVDSEGMGLNLNVAWKQPAYAL